MDLEYLRGRSILEVIVELPRFNWLINIMKDFYVRTGLQSLCFVYYEDRRPKTEVELYGHLDVSRGISLDDLFFINKNSGKMIGLSSMVRIRHHVQADKQRIPGSATEVELPSTVYSGEFAHIPMIDFDTDGDFDFMGEEELLGLIKDRVASITEIDRGVILRSGPKRNFHFLGIGRLLSQEDFITFLGLSLTMTYKRGDGRSLNLVDPRHVGYALTAMRYMAEVDENDSAPGELTRYDFQARFATLRITPKADYKDYPVVVDVLDNRSN